ncbi:MAG TPA: M4 family metallopeptidase [Tenuifilaceae bacterium]|nr:T9SS type A sorting domain-containing protein [Bacteroidales bacterium]HNV82544.1 M4 family metallopeptidase [Tenuifilaceae bacterium]
MRRFNLLAIFAVAALNCFSQSADTIPIISWANNGTIASAEYPTIYANKIIKIPVSAEAFFIQTLKIGEHDSFTKEDKAQKRAGEIHEHYDQYYKGIRVDGGGYNFHFKDDTLRYAHGYYVKIENINPLPSIQPNRAISNFAQYQGIPLYSIMDSQIEAIIKEIPTSNEQDAPLVPKLVFRIYLSANHANNTEVGFIDAHTGEVLMTEPINIEHSAIGVFNTRYNGIQQGVTQYYYGLCILPDTYRWAYNLADSTRGAIIHTWDLNGSTAIRDRFELKDLDNIWTSAEHFPSGNDVGQDAHWALQQIYDRLSIAHGINSFDDSGYPIDAYIHYGVDYDNAHWNTFEKTIQIGDGGNRFCPPGSLDAVAHEFGHGITDFQIGWAITGDQRAFHEGMSDIWAAIMEYRIRPVAVWKIGEQIDKVYQCIRNLGNTNDPNARTKMANTFGTIQYNKGNEYVRSGIFSHWFYRLVNGGTGVNGLGHSYKVYGVGMDLAEDLIAKAVFENYLDNTTTYQAIRTSMINAAMAMSAPNSFLVKQVENAWHAVGVGPSSSQPVINGNALVCGSNQTFTVDITLFGDYITWSHSNNLILVNGQGTNNLVVRASNNSNGGWGWIEATLNGQYGTITIPRVNVWVGTPSILLPPNTFTINGAPCVERGNYYIYNLINVLSQQPISTIPGANSYSWTLMPNDSNLTISTINNGQISCGLTISGNATLGNIYSLQLTAANSCGSVLVASKNVKVYNEFIICEDGGSMPRKLAISPNPATLEVNITEVTPTNDNIPWVIRIMTQTGVTLVTVSTQLPKTINVSNFNRGVYYLYARKGNYFEQQVFIIE